MRKEFVFVVKGGGRLGRGLEIGMDLKSASGKEKWYYENIFCQLGYICGSFGLALKDSPRACFARPPCHGGHEETKWFLFSDLV